MSLRYRIAATIFVLEALMMGLVLWRTVELSYTGYTEHMEATESVILRLIAEHCRPGLVTYEYAELQTYVDRIQDPRIRLILLTDYRNRVVAASDPLYVGSDLPDLQPQPEEHWQTVEIRNAAGPVGTLAIRFSHRNAHLHSQRILKNALLIAGLGMTLIAAVALIMGHLLTRRLVALGKAVRTLESGDLSVRADLRGGDEVTQVGRAFDEMARTLHENVSTLQEKEAQMRLLTNALPVGISYVDHDLRVRFVNRQLCKWLRSDPESILGESLRDSMAAEQFNVLKQGLDSALHGNIMHHEREFSIDGRPLTMDILNIPDIGSNGSVRGIYSLLRNISRRKSREVERESLLGELASKNAELEELAYTVSHDLKSPLITILSSVEYLEDAIKVSSQQDQGDLDRIRHAAETMDRMLDELLELARLGVVENKREPVNLKELAVDTTELLAGRIASKKATVRISETLPRVLGDRRRLQRVLLNLVDNGVKFTPDQDKPIVEIGSRPIDETAHEAVCTVRDFGVGIATDQLDQIFELFRQVDGKQEGTGIGLAITRRIVEGHGGRIWVESEGLGKGSTFCFTLPLPDSQEPIGLNVGETEPSEIPG